LRSPSIDRSDRVIASTIKVEVARCAVMVMNALVSDPIAQKTRNRPSMRTTSIVNYVGTTDIDPVARAWDKATIPASNAHGRYPGSEAPQALLTVAIANITADPTVCPAPATAIVARFLARCRRCRQPTPRPSYSEELEVQPVANGQARSAISSAGARNRPV
jgi:hypothetical protein